MIVRVLGEGQFRFDESHIDALNACDDAVEAALAADDQARLTEALEALLSEIRTLGEELPIDSLEESDLIVPAADATLAEVHALLGDRGASDGLIPGRG